MNQTTFEPTTPEYLSKSALHRRGWTDTAIARFLGAHDKEAPNPYCKSSSPMKLFKTGRVEHIEASEEYQHYIYSVQPKLNAAQKALKTKRDRLLQKVAEMEIFIQRKHLEEVIADAVNSYNSFKSNGAREREDFDYQPASINSDKDFLTRITVNFLRHRCSPYEKIIDEITGKVGKKEAYALLNQKIFQKIAETFPELKAECDRQLEEKIMGLTEDNDFIK